MLIRAPLVEYTESLDPAAEAQQQEMSDGYANRAIELLQRASQQQEFQNAELLQRLKEDHDLEFLRPRKEFQQLLEEVAPREGTP